MSLSDLGRLLATEREAAIGTITALAKAIEARDRHTGAHIERVQEYSVAIARQMGLDEETIWRVGVGAVLHDLGKIGVPDAVLNKRGVLTASETEVMRRHPVIGAGLLEADPALSIALPAVLHHHERWDGMGYPHGLAGDRISLEGRIVSVADAYDAMVSDRPYRSRLVAAGAVERIAVGMGTQFDPEVARAFLRLPQSVLRAHEDTRRFTRLAPVAA
ncbi:MAG TPA: HD-GYP domain-containing protein [Chloroflexota bacterium]|jgi:HD-GYP domain-containing protein (c-di-GMP phosphodiesterase class II)|nr:HD-GYP domain-containing protein [Chloroflexota bacterium]